MRDLRGARVAVVGAGVFGLAIATQITRLGADTTLYDARPVGDNASGIAAGMLAPAFETLSDGVADHFSILRTARDLWPTFVRSLPAAGTVLDRSGAVSVVHGDGLATLDPLLAALSGLGAHAERVDAAAIARLQPSIASDIAGGIYTAEDWALDPRVLLAAMYDAYHAAGGRVSSSRIKPRGGICVDDAELQADAIVLAVGADVRDWVGLAPELSAIQPIKGQILHFDVAPMSGPVIRGGFGYVAPQARGCIVGATMQAGRSDCAVEPDVLAGLRTGATSAFPHLATAAARGYAGVRASTPDGLPLVGRSSRPGLLLAVGARRNGWLLAPLVAQAVSACLLGDDPGPFASAFDPLRSFAVQPPRPTL